MDVGSYKNLKHQKNQTLLIWGLVHRDAIVAPAEILACETYH